MVSRTAPTAPAVAFCCRLTLRASVEHGGRDAETVDETVVPGGHMQPSQCAVVASATASWGAELGVADDERATLSGSGRATYCTCTEPVRYSTYE